MSQENMDLTRRAFQAFHDRDLDALLAMLDDDVEAFPILAGMEGGYRGHDGIRRWWAGLLGTFPDFSAEIVEYTVESIDAGDPPQPVCDDCIHKHYPADVVTHLQAERRHFEAN